MQHGALVAMAYHIGLNREFGMAGLANVHAFVSKRARAGTPKSAVVKELGKCSTIIVAIVDTSLAEYSYVLKVGRLGVAFKIEVFDPSVAIRDRKFIIQQCKAYTLCDWPWCELFSKPDQTGPYRYMLASILPHPPPPNPPPFSGTCSDDHWMNTASLAWLLRRRLPGVISRATTTMRYVRATH